MSNLPLCQRLCIDDLCRGNPDNTLCGGSYCDNCRGLKVDDGSLCDDCREEQNDYDEEEELTMTNIPEIDKTAYWKEILAGAEDDEEAVWKQYLQAFELSLSFFKRWCEAYDKAIKLRVKVREMEDSNG